MAKQQSSAAAARVRKKVKKNVAEGIAHVHASFNNTNITITDRQGKRCRGRPPVVLASRVRVNRPRSQRRLRLKRLVKSLLNAA